jgi:hypothetical protein
MTWDEHVDSRRLRRHKERELSFSTESRAFTCSQSCVKCGNMHVHRIYVSSLFHVATVLALLTLWILKIVMPSKSEAWVRFPALPGKKK